MPNEPRYLLRPWIRPLLSFLVTALLAACGGGGGGGLANTAPGVTVVAPSEDLEVGLGIGGSIEIAYVATDPDDAATTDVLADRDGDLATTDDQVAVALGKPERDGEMQTVHWDVSGAAPGTYRIVARTTDATHQATGTAPGRVWLNAPPTLALSEPALDLSLSRGARLRVTYVDDDADDAAMTAFALDGDGDAMTVADAYPISPWLVGSAGTAREIWLRTAGVSPGHYAVLGTCWDGTNPPATATAPGRIALRNVAWARSAGGPLGDVATAVATFADDSSVVVGSFDGTATFAFMQVGETTLVSDGYLDAFVARYHADGSLAWAKRAGGADHVTAEGVAALPDGSCIVAGTFVGVATFGPGETGETVLTSAGYQDVFVARYGADGSLTWAKRAGGADSDHGKDVAAFPDGTCEVVGTFLGTATFGPGETGEADLTGAGGGGAFVARYGSNGTLAWARSASHPEGWLEAEAVATNADGSSVIAGYFAGSMTFGRGEAGETTLDDNGAGDVFVACYEANGALLWARQGGGAGMDFCEGGLATYSDGSSLVAGHFQGNATFGEGEAGETTLISEGFFSSFVARYGADGTLAWARLVGGGGWVTTFGATTFADGTSAVAGYFAGGTFGSGEGGLITLGTVGGGDAFVSRHDTDGTLLWVRRAGGTGEEWASAVSACPDGSCVVTGGFEGMAAAVTFGAGDPGVTTLHTAGGGDIFLARLNADGGF